MNLGTTHPVVNIATQNYDVYICSLSDFDMCLQITWAIFGFDRPGRPSIYTP